MMNELSVVDKGRGQVQAVPDEVIASYLESFGNKLNQKYRNQFIQICKAFQLNPFIREIYGIPYGDNFNIIVGYEVYLKRAERSGLLAGWRAWTEGAADGLKGCVEIKRKDWTDPFYHEVYFVEYDQKNSMWKAKPHTMIKKVAIAQAFRMAFPEELGGMPYTADEIPLGNSEIVNTSTGEISQQRGAGKPVVTPPQSRSQQKSTPVPAADPNALTDSQKKMIFAKMKTAGIEPDAIKAAFGVASSNDLKKSQVEDVLKWIDAHAKKAEPAPAPEPDPEMPGAFDEFHCVECGKELDEYGECHNVGNCSRGVVR